MNQDNIDNKEVKKDEFFKFNVADKDHEKIWKKEKDLEPEKLLSELTESDEY